MAGAIANSEDPRLRASQAGGGVHRQWRACSWLDGVRWASHGPALEGSTEAIRPAGSAD
jgi:hypothetical protein